MLDKALVTVIDDEEHVRKACAQSLQLAGFNTETEESAENALDNLSRNFPGVLVTDVRLGGMDGMEFLSKVL